VRCSFARLLASFVELPHPIPAGACGERFSCISPANDARYYRSAYIGAMSTARYSAPPDKPKRPNTKRRREIAKQLRVLAPRMPLADFLAVEEGAAAGHLRHLPPAIALWQALASRVRHAHTDYEALLDDGYDRDAARFFVADAMNDVLADWGCHRRIDANEPEA